MSHFSFTLPDGRAWVPEFVTAIDAGRCIGCGRCFKVCGRAVLRLMAMNDEGEIIAVDPDDEDADEEYEKKVMTIGDAGDCVGCGACVRTCAKKSITRAPLPV